MVAAGLYKPSAIVGYRNRPVYIRGSRHTPMNHEAVRDAMPEYFRLLREERHPAVRVITRLDGETSSTSDDEDDSTSGKKNISIAQARAIPLIGSLEPLRMNLPLQRYTLY